MDRTVLLGAFLALLLLPGRALAETPGAGAAEPSAAPERVEVRPASTDGAIRDRLRSILAATGWFSAVEVDVRDGVVFLDGRTGSPEYRDWARQLAENTRDVAAVVNRLEVIQPSPWQHGARELGRLAQNAERNLPTFSFALLVLVLAWLAALGSARLVRRLPGRRLKPLLREVLGRMVAILVFLLGLYFVLRVAGLTRLAVTLLGGTGLAGLVFGFAFRDILENFLASILISLRNPFRTGDLIEVAGHGGVVQKVTTRGTVLVDYDGNHVQIPNATVYKNIIRNFTANPKRRLRFEIGVDTREDLPRAQEIALEALQTHPAVLADPEPLVLVDRLGSATVQLALYAWYDGTRYAHPQVQSALIRLVKQAFDEHDVGMPDEARERLFPEPVAVRVLPAEAPPPPGTGEAGKVPGREPAGAAVRAEGDLRSSDEDIRQQARTAPTPEAGPDLLGD